MAAWGLRVGEACGAVRDARKVLKGAIMKSRAPGISRAKTSRVVQGGMCRMGDPGDREFDCVLRGTMVGKRVILSPGKASLPIDLINPREACFAVSINAWGCG